MSSPMAPVAVKAAKAREWPTLPIRRGAHQQPMKKPMKCAEPRKPICAVVKSSASPEIASSGATPPVDSCRRMTDRNRAAKEMRRRMFRPDCQAGCGMPAVFRQKRVVFRAVRLFCYARHNADADQIAHKPGIACRSEGRAADAAGQQHGQVVTVARLRAALTVKAGIERDRAGDAAHGEVADDRGPRQIARDPGR